MKLPARLALVVEALVAVVTLPAPTVFAQCAPPICRWGGPSDVPAPSVTYLRPQAGPFHAPGRIAVDASGRSYVSDPDAGRVVVRDAYGRLESMKPGLRGPLGIAVDSAGRIYVSEATGSVSAFAWNWNLLFKLGQGDAEFMVPNDVAVDPSSGAVFVSDGAAHAVKVYSPAGQLEKVIGGRGRCAGQFEFPTAVHVSAGGEVFVADQGNDRVQVFDRRGAFLRCFGGRIGGMSLSTRFGRIFGVTSDAQGRIYVADAFQGNVQVFDAPGALLTTVGAFGEGPGQLRTPRGLAVDAFGRLLVASSNNGRVEVFGIDGFADPHVVAASVDLHPDTLSLASRRRFVTASIEIVGVNLEDVLASRITANGVPAELGPAVIGDRDEDGVPDLTVRFRAASVLATLSPENDTVVVTGELRDGTPFEGSDSVTLRRIRGEREHR